MKGTRDLRFHAILFGLALVATFLTWSRDISYDDENVIRIWDRDSLDILSFSYRMGDVAIRIERRSDQTGDFLWGTEVVEGDERRTTEFPVGPTGHTLLGRIAGLRTVRDLGPLSTEVMATLGIEGSADRLTVQFSDEERELTLGGETYGSGQRYAYEPATGMGYVLPREVIVTLSNGQGAVRERWLHGFPADSLAAVRVHLGGAVRTMLRIGDTGEWAEVGSQAPDVAFGTFMQRVGALAIEGFAVRPEPGSRVLLRIEYLAGDDAPLGFLELVRDDSREADPYFVVTETTRVPAQATTFLAGRVEEALAGALSGAARGSSRSSES